MLHTKKINQHTYIHILSTNKRLQRNLAYANHFRLDQFVTLPIAKFIYFVFFFVLFSSLVKTKRIRFLYLNTQRHCSILVLDGTLDG